MSSGDVKSLSQSASDAHLGKPKTSTYTKDMSLARKYGFPIPEFKRQSSGLETNQDKLPKAQEMLSLEGAIAQKLRKSGPEVDIDHDAFVRTLRKSRLGLNSEEFEAL